MNNVFAPHGNTKRITARTSVTSSVQMTVNSDFLKSDSYVITNLGPAIVAMGFGSSSAEARANARFPETDNTTGTFCFIVPPGQRTIDALSKDTVYFAASTASGTADVLITPGTGMVYGSLDNQSSPMDIASLVSYESGIQQELLQAILIELRTHTEFLREGLNVAEDPDLIRGDQTSSIL